MDDQTPIIQPASNKGHIGAHLKSLRKSAGLTLAQAAQESGVSLGYISAVEGGHRGAPSTKVLEKLALAYHADLGELLGVAERKFILRPAGRPYYGDSSPKGAAFRLEWALETIYRDLEFGAPSSALEQPTTQFEKLLVIDTYQRATGRVLMLHSEMEMIRRSRLTAGLGLGTESDPEFFHDTESKQE